MKTLIGFLIIGVTLLASCQHKQEAVGHEEYTCPMHPQVIKDEPGSCPICKMDLVKKEKTTSPSQTDSVRLNSVSSIQTVRVKKSNPALITKIQGVITYDERQATVVTSRISGRIEKLYVKYINQRVTAGQKLLDVYSPDLLNAQRELLYLIKSDPDNATLISSAKEKLILLGVSKQQTDEIAQSGKERASFSIFSPVTGFLISLNGNSNETEIDIREGNYVESGSSVLKIMNDNRVWAEFNIKQADAKFIKQGTPLLVKIKNEEVKASVDFIQPFFAEGEDFIKVRCYLNNENHSLKLGELVEATLSETQEGNWIPASSLVDLGTRKIVYVKTEDGFEAREIKTGNKSGDWIEVMFGISENDQVVFPANYVTDSESFVKVK